MHKVDFFIIGAQKAGTTSLYKYLAEHPDIFMPAIKENHFFCEDRFYERGEDFFHKYYADYYGEKLVGGAYVHMLSSPVAPERVYNYNKHAKIIIMLRNPVARAYSAYQFAVQNGWESEKNNFIDTLKLQEERQQGNFTQQTDLSYFHTGLYYHHITNWLKWFDKENIYILYDDELKDPHQKALKNLLRYLGVKDDVKINTSVAHNTSRNVRFKSMHHFIRNKESGTKKLIADKLPFKLKYFLRTKLRKAIDKFNITSKDYRPLSLEDKKTAFTYFEDDIKLLSDYTGKDLFNKWQPQQ